MIEQDTQVKEEKDRREIPEEVKAAEKVKSYRQGKEQMFADLLSNVHPKCGSYEQCVDSCPLKNKSRCAYREAKLKLKAYRGLSDEDVEDKLNRRNNRKPLTLEEIEG